VVAFTSRGWADISHHLMRQHVSERSSDLGTGNELETYDRLSVA